MSEEMKARAQLEDLAARCERAEESSRELDALVHQALGFTLWTVPDKRHTTVGSWIDPDGRDTGWLDGCESYPPHYSGSLDAAVTLVPDGAALELHIRSNMADAYLWPDDREDGIRGHAATPALALCAASLRSIAQERRG